MIKQGGKIPVIRIEIAILTKNKFVEKMDSVFNASMIETVLQMKCALKEMFVWNVKMIEIAIW